MKQIILALSILLCSLIMVNVSVAQEPTDCLFFGEAVAGEDGFFVCDDESAQFRSAFLDSITQENRTNNIIFLNLSAKRPADQVCLAVLVPFEETVALDLTGLTPGTYTVKAGGMSATFELP